MTAGNPSNLARQAAFVAADLDRRGYPMASVVRMAARALLELDPPAAGCRGCGAALPVQSGGRPRVWCGEPCRRRHRR